VQPKPERIEGDEEQTPIGILTPGRGEFFDIEAVVDPSLPLAEEPARLKLEGRYSPSVWVKRTC
jgi:hypothetical protein